MKTNLTRRGLITAAPAAVAAASLLPMTGSGAAARPDAELLALCEPYERTLADLQVAAKKHSPFEEAYFQRLRADPGADHDQVAAETGYDVAEDEYESVVSANTEVIDQIAGIQALTFEGILFKAEIAHREDLYKELVGSVIDDLVAMRKA